METTTKETRDLLPGDVLAYTMERVSTIPIKSDGGNLWFIVTNTSGVINTKKFHRHKLITILK